MELLIKALNPYITFLDIAINLRKNISLDNTSIKDFIFSNKIEYRECGACVLPQRRKIWFSSGLPNSIFGCFFS